MLDCFVTNDCVGISLLSAETEMIVIDGAVAVHFLHPQPGETFFCYKNKFVTYISSQFTGSIHQIDVVFDDYHADSLKATLEARNWH